MKAFVVSAEGSEVSELVFAEKASRAKTLAHGSDWLHWYDYTELTCRREPKADKCAGTIEGVLCIDDADGQRILRDLGWRRIDGFDEVCNDCERYEWDDVPESKLSEIRDTGKWICKGCKKVKI